MNIDNNQKIEIIHSINKMYCAQNNRIYCSDCNKSFLPNSYSNHLRTKGHNINVMKKLYCSCNNVITHSNNHDLTCSMYSLSHKSDVDIQTDFSNVKQISKSEQTKEKDIGSEILLLKFRNYHDSESFTEAKAVLQKIYRVLRITGGEHVSCHDGYAHMSIDM